MACWPPLLADLLQRATALRHFSLRFDPGVLNLHPPLHHAIAALSNLDELELGSLDNPSSQTTLALSSTPRSLSVTLQSPCALPASLGAFAKVENLTIVALPRSSFRWDQADVGAATAYEAPNQVLPALRTLVVDPSVVPTWELLAAFTSNLHTLWLRQPSGAAQRFPEEGPPLWAHLSVLGGNLTTLLTLPKVFPARWLRFVAPLYVSFNDGVFELLHAVDPRALTVHIDRGIEFFTMGTMLPAMRHVRYIELVLRNSHHTWERFVGVAVRSAPRVFVMVRIYSLPYDFAGSSC